MTLKQKSLIALLSLLIIAMSGTLLTITGTYTEWFSYWQPSPINKLFAQLLILAGITAFWHPLLERLEAHWQGVHNLIPYRWPVAGYGIVLAVGMFTLENLSWA